MMGRYFLCIFALVALRSVMAIHCYKCLLKPPNELCLSPTNVTDCDEPLKGLYDACAKGSYETELAGNKQRINFMTCMRNSTCGVAKKIFCNATITWQLYKINVKKCDFSCCLEDKCNSGTRMNGAGSSEAILFTTAFLSVLAIIAGLFVH